MRVTAETLKDLKKEVPYKWKVQTAKSWGCECVAYIDARDVMDLLDDVVGPQNWQDHYREVAGKVYCDLSIQVEDEWVVKSDCGTESNFEREKGQASDAFKRAAVKWGVGRFLYQLSTVRTKSIESGKDDRGNPRFFPADEQGQRIYNLSGYIQNLQSRKSSTGFKPTPSTGKQPEPAQATVTTTSQQPAQGQAPQSPPASEALKNDVMKAAQAAGFDNKTLAPILKNRGMTWKGLTTAQAEALIGHLKERAKELKENLARSAEYEASRAATV